jgi:hypothetical protein
MIRYGMFGGFSKGAKSTQYIQRGPKYGRLCWGKLVDPGESEVSGTEQRSTPVHLGCQLPPLIRQSRAF